MILGIGGQTIDEAIGVSTEQFVQFLQFLGVESISFRR